MIERTSRTNQPEALPVETLRSLGITTEGEQLENQYLSSWKEQSRLANERRSLMAKLLRRNRVSAQDIAQEETRRMIERATELSALQGKDPTEEALRLVYPQIALEFKPKTVRQLRAEFTADKAEGQLKRALASEKWAKAAKIVRKTAKRLAETDTLDGFLVQTSDIVHSKLSGVVKNEEGREFVKALVAFDGTLVDQYQISIQKMPNLDPEMLDNQNFLNGIDNQLQYNIRLDFFDRIKRDRKALLRAGISETIVDSFPGVKALVLEKLSSDLRIQGPTYFARKANDFQQSGLKVDWVFDSEPVQEIVNGDLIDDLRIQGPEYFAKKILEFQQAGLQTDDVLETEAVEDIVFGNLVNALRVQGPDYFAREAEKYAQAKLGSHIAKVIGAEETVSIVADQLTNALRIQGPEYFAKEARKFQHAGLDIKQVLASNEIRAIVLHKLSEDLRVQGVEYFSRSLEQFRNAGLDTQIIFSSDAVLEIVKRDLEETGSHQSTEQQRIKRERYLKLGFHLS